MRSPLRSVAAGVFALVLCVSAVFASDVGLVGYYKFDIDARDYSLAANDGLMQGAVIVTQGVFGGACEFDGIDDCVIIPHQDALASPQFFNLDHGVIGFNALGCQMGAGAGLFLGFAVGQIPFLHCCSVFRVAVLPTMITGAKKKATLGVAFFTE